MVGKLNFDNASKVKDELWDLLRKEMVFVEWDVHELFLMTSTGEVFNVLDGERLLKVFKMPTLKEFLDRRYSIHLDGYQATLRLTKLK
ncbi:hypothetical protein FACUT_2912 [Fusarium acutatum]|uniref:Uncharacterized protein n=1 Tax=Fusarium acutatum TaxID=78861 RepID=A0A8H4K205_9HYPO|nr:hypothetical protein FACUT_2912 [Fusarium acutatum]